tara:strand:- start:1257 stop:1895 length:639 start_codon:yes stop_codon:yes gene_type:complete
MRKLFSTFGNLPHSFIEEELFKSGVKNIVGIDEAGRGSIAGPVVSASVILEEKLLIGNPLKLNDSKKLSSKSRKKMFDQIINSKSIFSIGISNNHEVDNEGIISATKNSMKRSLSNINYDYALIDSIDLIIDKPYFNFDKADSISTSVAAASIIAKVSRDSMMLNIYDKLYPDYFFKNNKGYGSHKHIENIKKIGICTIHRKTFKPCSEIIK